MRALDVIKGLLLGTVAALSPRAFAEWKAFAVVYDGFGTPTAFSVGGRVLEDQAERAPSKDAGTATNIVENIKALESDEVRGAAVAVTIAGQTFTSTTDDDGNFLIQVKNLPKPLPLGMQPVSVAVTEVPGRKIEKVKIRTGAGHVYVYDDKAPFTAIVSDVDDTVVKTYVTEKRKMVGAVLFNNALTLEPVAGAAANYRAARDAGVLGFFYLSGSPQNFYTRIQGYLAAQQFPAGPIFLKNFGDDSLTQQQGYKLKRLEALLEALPQMRVILVGDSGEHDPEIYAELRKKHPARVAGIVIRKTPSSDARAGRFSDMTVVDDAYAGDRVIAQLLAPPPAPPSVEVASP